MNSWFRWYHGAVSDDKWKLIARKSKQPQAFIVAVWALLLEIASQANERGSVADFDAETADALLDMPDGAAQAIYDALCAGSNPRIVEGKIVAWEKRQPIREDNSAERVRRYREKKRESNAESEDVTQCNACVTHDNASVTARIDKNRIEYINTPLTPLEGDECACSIAETPKLEKAKRTRRTKADLPPYTDEFEQLWKEYPRKDGKGNAYRVYLTLLDSGQLPEHEDFRQRIISRRYEPDWEKDNGQYVPHMATWLNGRGWEDAGCEWQKPADKTPSMDDFEDLLDDCSWTPTREEYRNPAKYHARQGMLTEKLKAAGF